LALDPHRVDARRALVNLFTDFPEQLPREAEAEMELNRQQVKREGARYAWWSYLSWSLTIPYVALLGIRSWLVFLLTAAFAVFSAVYARVAMAGRGPTMRDTFILAGASFSTIGLLACWLGPFVLVPTAAAINTVLFATYATGRLERRITFTLGIAAVVLPFVGDLLHLFPPAFAFRDGALVLLPRAVSIPPTLTLVALIYTSVMFTALPAVFLVRVRDALSRAERRMFLQAWHLKRLVSE
jgi:serine/threonine-protein kinase